MHTKKELWRPIEGCHGVVSRVLIHISVCENKQRPGKGSPKSFKYHSVRHSQKVSNSGLCLRARVHNFMIPRARVKAPMESNLNSTNN